MTFQAFFKTSLDIFKTVCKTTPDTQSKVEYVVSMNLGQAWNSIKTCWDSSGLLQDSSRQASNQFYKILPDSFETNTDLIGTFEVLSFIFATHSENQHSLQFFETF